MAEGTTPASTLESNAEFDRREVLAAILRRSRRLLVAFSGGVDSTYLLQAAVTALGADRVLAVTGVSASLATREREETIALAARIGARHRLVETYELENPDYAANPRNRCYFCKSELFDRLRAIATAEGFDTVADGTNVDDEGDVRPGRAAAREHGVTSPLLEAGIDKASIRAWSAALGLPTADKPEMPCLASRIPFGSAVDREKLRSVEIAEAALRSVGLIRARVRHHGDIARIELPAEELDRLMDQAVRAAVSAGVRAAGFEYVTLDLDGYRRGRQDEVARRAGVEWRPGRFDSGS
jgi:uncharacterized protein